VIVYTVYDASDDIEMMFSTKRAAIAFAKELTGNGSTDVRRVDIGKPTKQRVCDCFNREGYGVSSEKIYTTS
jgi:hypothetical protein